MYQMRALFRMRYDRVKLNHNPQIHLYYVTSFLKLQPTIFFIPFISPFCFLLSPSHPAVGVSFISKTAAVNLFFFLQILDKAILMHHRGSHLLLNAPCIQSQERLPVLQRVAKGTLVVPILKNSATRNFLDSHVQNIGGHSIKIKLSKSSFIFIYIIK